MCNMYDFCLILSSCQYNTQNKYHVFIVCLGNKVMISHNYGLDNSYICLRKVLLRSLKFNKLLTR